MYNKYSNVVKRVINLMKKIKWIEQINNSKYMQLLLYSGPKKILKVSLEITRYGISVKIRKEFIFFL